MEIVLYVEFIHWYLKWVSVVLIACVPALIQLLPQHKLMAVFGLNNCKNAGKIV